MSDVRKMNLRERGELCQRIADDLLAGATALAVSERYGVSYPFTRRVRDDWGITPLPSSHRRLGVTGLSYRPSAETLARRAELDNRRIVIVERFEAGETMQSIGISLGITRERVRQILRKAGSKASRARWRERDAAIAEAVKVGNLTSDEAAAQFAVPRALVTKVSARAGVKPRTPHVYDAPEYAEMAAKVEAGLSVYQAAGRVHRVEARLADYCRAHGIKTNLHGRWRDLTARAAIIKGMVAAGAAWDDIADAVGGVEGVQVGGAAIYNWASKRGLTGGRRPLVARKPPKPRMTKAKVPGLPPILVDDVKEAARLNYGRVPASEIAKALGVSRNSIIGHWFRLRKAGLIPAQSEAA